MRYAPIRTLACSDHVATAYWAKNSILFLFNVKISVENFNLYFGRFHACGIISYLKVVRVFCLNIIIDGAKITICQIKCR